MTTCSGTTQLRSTVICIRVADGDPLLKSELSYYSFMWPFLIRSLQAETKICMHQIFHISPCIPIHNYCIITLFFCRSLATAKVHKFSEKKKPPQPHKNCRHQKGAVKEIPHRGSISIRGHRRKFSPPGELAAAIRSPLH